MSDSLSLLAQLLGPLLGAGAGSYFGLKSALNGLRATTARTEERVNEVRDFARDTAAAVDRLERRVEDCPK